MSRKRALVVDDSKSARLVLKRLLERHDLEVDTAESAEDALAYLLRRRPNVVFMDHMMPGMDGFQAVRAIKSDPRTAAIPIMMYTSRQEETYLRDARAVGAAGVLLKGGDPAALLTVLDDLGLGGPAAVSLPAALADAAMVPAEARIGGLALEATEEAIDRILAGRLEALRRQLGDDLRAGLSSLTDRLEPPQRRPWATLLVLLALLAPLIYWLARTPPAPPVTPAAAAVTPAESERSGLLRTLALQRVRNGEERARLLETVSWALNQSGQYEFDQIAFGDERLASLSDLLRRLTAIGFEGAVRLESHVGRFCLQRDSGDDLRPAPPELPLQRCDSIGFERDRAQALGERQSLAFANFLATSPLLRGKIELQLVSLGDDSPRYPYPQAASIASAGHWNEFARRNQRVEVSLLPSR